MADLVNQTHKSALAPRNAEPSHLSGGDVDSIGGPSVTSQPGGDDYRLDGARGISKDTSIPASVGPEASHLKSEDDDAADDVEVKFDEDDDVDVDDLDKQLEELDSLEPVDIDLDTDLREDDEEDDEKKIDEDDEEDKDKDKVDEDDENPFAKKDDEKVDESDDEDDEKKDKLDESEDKDDEDKIDEDDEDDEEDGEKKIDEADCDCGKDDCKTCNPVTESLKLRVKMPDVKIFEAAGIGARTQKKVGVIFESAIRQVTKQVAAQVAAHYKKLHESKIARRDAVMAKQMDGYLSYVVEEWTRQNRPAIRQSLRTQLAEEFLNGLQRLFKEHYIDVPESKVDVVAKLTEQNNRLKSALNESAAKAVKMRKLTEAVNKRRIVAEFALSQRLSEASTAKLQKLAEDVAYANAKDFREKLAMLKESYLAESKVAKPKSLPAENVVITESTKKPAKAQVSEYPEVAAVAAALDKKSTW